MQFLEFDRGWEVLKKEDVVSLDGDSPSNLEFLQLDFDESRPAHRMVFSAREDHVCEVHEAEQLNVPRAQAGEVIEHVLQKLHLAPLLIFPISKWRDFFNSISPILVDNSTWMEIDTSATVELNTRDPLGCDSGDFHMLTTLIDTVLEHGDSLKQGISIAAISAPVLIEVEPNAGILVTLGNPNLAEQVRSVAEHVVQG